MDYFLLKQDKRFTNTPRIKNLFKSIDIRNVNRINSHKIEEVNIVQVQAEDSSQYLDILDNQLFLVSDKLIRILKKYDPQLIVKYFPLIDAKRNRQENYYLPIFEEVNALHVKAEYINNGAILKEIILDKNKIHRKKIFKLQEKSKNLIIVRLDVAESILRRKPNGISLKRVEVI